MARDVAHHVPAAAIEEGTDFHSIHRRGVHVEIRQSECMSGLVNEPAVAPTEHVIAGSDGGVDDSAACSPGQHRPPGWCSAVRRPWDRG